MAGACRHSTNRLIYGRFGRKPALVTGREPEPLWEAAAISADGPELARFRRSRQTEAEHEPAYTGRS